MTSSPFNDIRALLADLPPAAPRPAADPSLGRLGELSAFLKAWKGGLNRPICALYAGSSGAAPQDVRAALEAVAAGAAPAAAIAQATGAGLEAFDLAIDRPLDPKGGMTERECAATMAFGMEALAKQPDLLMTAVLGDDGGSAAANVMSALAAGEEPLDALRRHGDRQIAAVAGAIAAARTQGVPVLLDGPAAVAAAAVLAAVEPRAAEHCLAARDVLDMDLPGEGGVAALTALQVLRAAAAL